MSQIYAADVLLSSPNVGVLFCQNCRKTAISMNKQGVAVSYVPLGSRAPLHVCKM